VSNVLYFGIKTFLDGGMLTGSAYMREPWGVSTVYSITDPSYRGMRYIAADRFRFGEATGRWAFWLYNAGLVMWILFNFFPIGWPQLDAVYEHGLAYARSSAFYDTTLFWQWMRLPGDVVFAAAALMMAWDFVIKLRPLFPRFVDRLLPGHSVLPAIAAAE